MEINKWMLKFPIFIENLGREKQNGLFSSIVIKLSFWFLVVICSACSSEKIGLDELKKLCEKDGGLTIYKTVEEDGYYNAYSNDGVSNGLIKGPYSFYEFCDESPSLSRYNIFPDPGCFRVKRVRRDSGQCDQKVDESLSRFTVEPYPEFLKNHCIAVEKIEKPVAGYSYEVERKEWFINESAGMKMARSTEKIINTKTREIAGKGIVYSFYPGWLHSETRSKYKSAIGCGSPQVTGLQKTIPFAKGVIEKTLVPRIGKIGELK